MRNKKQKVMKEKEVRCSTGKKLFIAGAFIVTSFGIATAIKHLISKKKESKEENELVYSCFMNGIKDCPSKADVYKITIKATMSGIDLDLRDLDLSRGLWIRIDAVMSGICIRIPENIQVETDLDVKLSGISNNIPDYLDTSLPIIHVIGKANLSGVDIKFVY